MLIKLTNRMALYVYFMVGILTIGGVLASPIGTTVITSKGTIIGQNSTDGNYMTFFGVPYGKVDEENPFGNSLEYPDFEMPYEASDPTVVCPQANFRAAGEKGILQCLQLNIYVPKSATTDAPLPVLLWFHGGLFSGGGGHELDGQYLARHGIIVITANYRLGPYGFLCLDNPKVPGNQGLKDQMEAMRWVSQQIGRFGGDRDAITIGGESAGGGSVDLHLYSNYEQLFDKVAIHSGSSFVEGMFSRADYDAANKLAYYFGHASKTTEESLSFLAEKSPHEVVRAFIELGLELRPCQEKKFNGVSSFINNNPFELGLTTPSKIKNTKIMTGYDNKEEFRTYADKDDNDYKSLQNIFYDKFAKNFILPQSVLNTLADITQSFYLGSQNISKEAMLELCDFTSDFIMNHASETSVSKYVRCGAPVIYKWSFSFVGDDSLKHIPGAGASHTEDVAYLFGLRNENATEDQLLMMEKMLTMWSNFVKYGNPTPSDRNRTLLPVDWVPLTSDYTERAYMNINITMEMRSHLYHSRMAFWDLIWNSYWQNSVLILEDRSNHHNRYNHHHHNHNHNHNHNHRGFNRKYL